MVVSELLTCNRIKSSLCCLMLVIITSTVSSTTVDDSEDPTVHGLSAWHNYCYGDDHKNDTVIRGMTECQLNSANLRSEKLSECMKKYFPSDYNGSGLSKIKKAQCDLPMKSFEKKKVREVSLCFFLCTIQIEHQCISTNSITCALLIIQSVIFSCLPVKSFGEKRDSFFNWQ